MEHDCNIALLDEVYKNASMGITAIDMLIPKVRDSKLYEDLKSQRSNYFDIISKASGEIVGRGRLPETGDVISKSMLWLSIQLNTLMHTQSCHLAQMMINGSSMGVQDMQTALSEHTNAEEEVFGLADELVELERHNIQRMKAYVH